MNFPFFIAKRYLISRRKRNAVNIISGISVLGVTIGTMALVIVLSVFNGFDGMVRSMFSAFDPDIKISIVKGKVFNISEDNINEISGLDGVLFMSKVLEENALLKYGERQVVATIKGVDKEFRKTTEIDSFMLDGEFRLYQKKNPMSVVGAGVAQKLVIGLNFINPIHVYVPKRTTKSVTNLQNSFHKNYIFPSGIFSIQPEYDSKYIILPLDYAQNLLEYDKEISALELKLALESDGDLVKEEIENILGVDFKVESRYELNKMLYKAMNSEKWAIFAILTLILIVATFNILGSLTMLIIEKKEDILTLKKLGASDSLIQRIFLIEGWMISFIGAIVGFLLGVLVCWIQETYGVVKLMGSGMYIIDAYPVKVVLFDLTMVLLTVIIIGLLAAWYPVKVMSKPFLKE